MPGEHEAGAGSVSRGVARGLLSPAAMSEHLSSLPEALLWSQEPWTETSEAVSQSIAEGVHARYCIPVTKDKMLRQTPHSVLSLQGNMHLSFNAFCRFHAFLTGCCGFHGLSM